MLQETLAACAHELDQALVRLDAFFATLARTCDLQVAA